MSDFPALATKLVTSTFGQFQKPLTIHTVAGSKETGTAIDIKQMFKVGKTEDTEFVLVTDVAQWNKSPVAGNIDLVFDGVDIEIVKVDQDPASAAYFIHANSYERITTIIQSVVETPDGQGGFTSAWSTFATVESRVQQMTASETIENGRLNASNMIEFRFRYVAGITEKMRVSVAGEFMPIRSVVDNGLRNEWLDVVAEKGAAS